MNTGKLIHFIILYFAIYSSIGVWITKKDEDNWQDRSALVLAIIASFSWALYFTMYA